MQRDRRRFLNATALGLASATLPWTCSRALATSVQSLGSSSLTVVSDGHLVLPVQFVLPGDIPSADVMALLEQNDLSTTEFEPACNACLWKTVDRLVLFDVGAGPNFMPTAGKLLGNIEASGFEASDVTDVVFTHAHPDHLWGLIDDFDELTFPDARYHMNALEWDFWRAPETVSRLPDARKVFAVGAQSRLLYLEDRIELFDFGDEVLPGVEAVDTSGHTPGHTSFALHHDNEAIMIIGDAITHPVLSFAQPGWPSGSDQDKDRGRDTRLQLLDRLATDKMSMLGFHLPYPGLGQAEKQGSSYRWVAK